MKRLARIIVEKSRIILVATGLITITALVLLTQIQFNADVGSFVLEGNETGEAFADLQDRYAAGDPITIVAQTSDGSTFSDPTNLAALAAYLDQVKAVEGVDSVASLLPDVNPVTGEPVTAEMIGTLPEVVVSQLIEQNPLADLLLAEDQTATMAFASALSDQVAVARAVSDVETPVGLEITLAGNPVVFASVLDVLSFFLLLVPPLVIVAMVAVFYLNIGDRKLSAMAVLPAIVGSIWTFGMFAATGRAIDVVTVIVPIFVIVMGSADGLHFITHFQDRAGTTDDKVELVHSALRHVGIPMILTTVSTAAGFLSLTLTGVAPIEELGLFAAIGITFAGVVSLFSLPALISRQTIRPAHHKAVLGPGVVKMLRAAIKTRVPAAVLILAIVGFAAVFVPQLEVNPDQLFFFKADDPVREAFETTEDLFGGATPLVGEFAYQDGDDLGEIAALSRELETLGGVRRVFSVADLEGRVPESQMQAVLSGAMTLPFGDMVSESGLRFVLLPADFSTEDLRSWLDFADSEPGIEVLTGMPVVWDEIARLVIRSQVISLAVAFGLVTLLLGVAYRRVRETIISLVPIILTVATLLGFLAVSGIQLNLLTAVLSSIVIGVGIDYAIHFVAGLDLERSDGPGYALRAVGSVGRPIVANALGIAVALSALWLSPLAIHGQVSMIMWVSMTTASATALVVIPALLPRDAVSEQRVSMEMPT